MDEKTFTTVLDSIKGFSDYLFFHVKGEPLLHPLLGRFLDICSERKFMVNLATNGTLIARAGDRMLDKPALRQVSFSLHSLGEHNDPSSRERYLDDILSFTVKALLQTRLLVEYKLWNLEQGMLNNSNRFILDYVFEKLGLQGEVSENTAVPGRSRLSDRVYLNMAERFSWPDINSEEKSAKGFCYGLRTQVAVLVDGTVVPCCLDGEGAIRLGNIHDSSFASIVNSERARNISLGFSKRIAVEEMCRKCTYRKRFDILPHDA